MGRPVQHDRLVASYYRGKRATGWACGNRVVIEAVPLGWWYSAPLPAGLGIFAFLSHPRDRLNLQSWHAAMSAAEITRERFDGVELSTRIGVTGAGSWQSPVIAGSAWVACGDAAASRDPLSSQGVYSALTSGISAARTLLGEQSQEHYVNSAEKAYSQYLFYRQRYYSEVQRFSSERFWREKVAPRVPSIDVRFADRALGVDGPNQV
jgi:flavin-dependent dehydrogenase